MTTEIETLTDWLNSDRTIINRQLSHNTVPL